jgi:hypothetical protein
MGESYACAVQSGSSPDEPTAPTAGELELVRGELREAQARLLEAEALLARLPALEHEAERRRRADAVELERLEAELRKVTASRSWRLTRPLRDLKRAVRRVRPRSR